MIDRWLLEEVPGVVVNDPAALDRWTAGRTGEQIVTDAIADLGPLAQVDAVAAMEAPTFDGAVVARASHPQLADLLTWATARPSVVLLATPSGPPPPAVVIVERAGR